MSLIIKVIKAPLLLALLAFTSGCASTYYTYGTDGVDENDGDSRVVDKQFIVGKPNKVLDASDWYWPGSLLAKLILWNHKIDSHEISDETIETMRLYMDRNRLEDVQVLVNTYKPGVQWSRTFQNKEVGAGWRYTLGILSAIQYTILPGRFFGGDHYNPYSNTISIYSDLPAVALHEAAHAKDTNSRQNKGLYSALYIIPGVPLYHEAVASGDTLSYLHENCDLDGEKEAYRVLHPAYSTYVGSTLATYAQSPELALYAVLPGHLTGAIGSANTKYKEGCPVNPEQELEESKAAEDSLNNADVESTNASTSEQHDGEEGMDIAQTDTESQDPIPDQ